MTQKTELEELQNNKDNKLRSGWGHFQQVKYLDGINQSYIPSSKKIKILKYLEMKADIFISTLVFNIYLYRIKAERS